MNVPASSFYHDLNHNEEHKDPKEKKVLETDGNVVREVEEETSTNQEENCKLEDLLHAEEKQEEIFDLPDNLSDLSDLDSDDEEEFPSTSDTTDEDKSKNSKQKSNNFIMSKLKNLVSEKKKKKTEKTPKIEVHLDESKEVDDNYSIVSTDSRLKTNLSQEGGKTNTTQSTESLISMNGKEIIGKIGKLFGGTTGGAKKKQKWKKKAMKKKLIWIYNQCLRKMDLK